MKLAPSVVPPAERRLERFVAFYHGAGKRPQILERITALYAPVYPVVLEEEDLRGFLSLLYLATRYFKPRAVVQTGTFVGTSSVAMGLALEENGVGELRTIDPEPPGYFGVVDPVSVARRVAWSGGLQERISFVRGYSTLPLDGGRIELVSAPPWQLRHAADQGPYDMLVVDGDHTFFGAYLDLLHGAEGLAPDGPRIVVVHDCLGIPDVKKAFRRWCDEIRPASMRVVPSACGIGLAQLRAPR